MQRFTYYFCETLEEYILNDIAEKVRFVFDSTIGLYEPFKGYKFGKVLGGKYKDTAYTYYFYLEGDKKLKKADIEYLKAFLQGAVLAFRAYRRG